ncbi:MAG: peptidase MA family metallohydrolase [Sporomusaceae bacterium]|nr:peptidase MA family metallohydrolase [Sporomusaceae bacterium]
MQTAGKTEITVIAGLLFMAVCFLLFTQFSLRPRLWLYPLARQAAAAKLSYEARQFQQQETEHFIIVYPLEDADQVQLVAKAAEAAYEPVRNLLAYSRSEKSILYIQPGRSELRKALGWSGDESAMGVYYGGSIQILSPKAWMQPDDGPEVFWQNGPVAHEFTHLLLDYQTNGNYTRWYTEGLAQYAEYKITHYEWLTGTNKLTGPLYSLSELDDHFDDLDNQSLAYREAFAAVRFIAERQGEQALQEIDRQLAQGVALKQALTTVTGLSYSDYETAWKAWAAKLDETRERHS